MLEIEDSSMDTPLIRNLNATNSSPNISKTKLSGVGASPNIQKAKSKRLSFLTPQNMDQPKDFSKVKTALDEARVTGNMLPATEEFTQN